MFNNFNEYQTSPEHILWLLDGDKANIQVEFMDGSSYKCLNRSQYWYLNGKCHRTDGPAVIYADGSQYWFLNARVHRTDGPAIIFANGAQRWYLNGIERTEKEHAAAVKKMKK